MMTKKYPMAAILLLLGIQLAEAIPFACFADGYVFNENSLAVPNGTKINITVQSTDHIETVETHTGYPLYPPVQEYDNQYKSVFSCERGIDQVRVTAFNETHFAEATQKIPEDGQALINLTMRPIIAEPQSLYGRIKEDITGLIRYLIGQ